MDKHKYFFSSTNNEGGRDMIKSAYLLHRERVTNVKSAVDSSKPKTLSRRPPALAKRTVEKKSNPDPTVIRSPRNYSPRHHPDRPPLPDRPSTSSIHSRSKLPTLIRPNTAHTNEKRHKSTPHVTEEQYYKIISEDRAKQDRMKLKQALSTSALDYKPELTKEERFEKIINNTPRIRHNMSQKHVKIYDEFVRMLVDYEEEEFMSIIQGAQEAAHDAKILSQASIGSNTLTSNSGDE